MISVNTNYSALIALQNLSKTTADLNATQNRISTGLKVSSAKDNGAVFAIAQGQRSRVSSLSAVRDGIDRASAAIDLGVSAGESIGQILMQMKEKAVSAQATDLTTDQRNALQADWDALFAQIDQISEAALFNGANLVDGTNVAAQYDVLTSDQGASITLTAVDWHTGTAGQALAGVTALLDLSDATNATAAADAIDAANIILNTDLATLGSQSRALGIQKDFLVKLSDTIENGISNLVDADLAKESALLQALQVKQQLGAQALSIANGAPAITLSFFR